MKPESIEGERTVLREFSGPAELEQIRVWRNIPENRRMFFTGTEIAPEEHLAWHEKMLADDLRCVFAIADRESDRLLGYISFLIMPETDRVEFGIMIGEKTARGGGHAAEAERLLCGYVAEKHDIGVAVMEVFHDNERAISFYRKQGYETETRNVKGRMRDGIPCDSITMTKCIS